MTMPYQRDFERLCSGFRGPFPRPDTIRAAIAAQIRGMDLNERILWKVGSDGRHWYRRKGSVIANALSHNSGSHTARSGRDDVLDTWCDQEMERLRRLESLLALAEIHQLVGADHDRQARC